MRSLLPFRLCSSVHILPYFFLDNDKVAAYFASFALISRVSWKRNPLSEGKERERENVIKAYKAEVQYIRLQYAAMHLNYQVEWLLD